MFRHYRVILRELLNNILPVLVTDKLNAQISFFIISLLYSSTCFEHYVLIIRRSKLYYTASGIVKPVGGRPVHRTATCRIYTLMWSTTKIIQKCTVSKTLKTFSCVTLSPSAESLFRS